MKKHFLSFVSNFKNENPYLKEWIDFHLSVGVDHLYLYDQCGSEESKQILAPFVQKKLVTVHDWTNIRSKYDRPTFFFQKNKNHMAYMHAAANYRCETEWLQKIDLDEFLFVPDDNSSIKEWLQSLDKSSIRAVRVPRIDFGPNDHSEKPVGGVLQNYTTREAEPSDYKDLANTDFLNNNNFCFSSHRWSYQLFPRGKIFEPSGFNELRINHYFTKSKEEYFGRQNISRARPISEEDFKKIETRTSQVKDAAILNFLPIEPKQPLSEK